MERGVEAVDAKHGDGRQPLPTMGALGAGNPRRSTR